MMRSREKVAWVLLFIVVAAFSLAPYILAPRPYWGVELVETRQDGVWRYITANFTKGECRREDVVFLGHRLGLTDNLTKAWQGLDGVEDGHDRLEGEQTLRGRLYTGAVSYEAIEIRTRHDCDGKRVDKVFLRIDNANK